MSPSEIAEALDRCLVNACEKRAVRRFRCEEHQMCFECGAPESHYRECPKVDAGGLEPR